VAGVFAILTIFWPGKCQLPAAGFSIGAFLMVVMFLPACRPVTGALLCPWNWALAVFASKLLLMPLYINLAGLELGELPHLPSDAATNWALALQTLGFLAFAIGYQSYWTYAGFRRMARAGSPPEVLAPPSRRVIAVYILVGCAGLLLSFGSLHALLAYFTDPASYLLSQLGQDPAMGKLSSVAGLFLKSFLGFAFVFAFCRLLDSGRQRSRLKNWALSVLLLLLVAMGFATYNYNRAAFIIPLLSLCAVILGKQRKEAWRYLVSVGLILAILFACITLVRVSRNTVAETGIADLQDASRVLTFRYIYQVYGGAPQFLGFALEQTHWGDQIYGGRTILSSILQPLPIAGKSFRQTSGTALYNALLNRSDQVAPFESELFFDFHVPGVILGFALLGWLIGRLQAAFLTAPSALRMFIAQYTASWLLFLAIGSISVVSQIFAYFFWPIYVYAAGGGILRTLKGTHAESR